MNNISNNIHNIEIITILDTYTLLYIGFKSYNK